MLTSNKKILFTTLASAFSLQTKAEASFLNIWNVNPDSTIRSISQRIIVVDPDLLRPGLILLQLFLFSILIFFIIRFYISWKRNQRLNEKMVHFIQTVYDLQKTLKIIKGPLDEISRDQNLSDSNKSKLHVAIWSTSSIQKTIEILMEQQKSDQTFKRILKTTAIRKNNIKEDKESNNITYRQLKVILEESGNNALENDGLIDLIFLEKIVSILKANLEDTRFTVDMLCEKIGMSRSSLYHRMKDITGQAPADFVRQYRLERAKELLSTHHYTISEAAYKTGFSDVKYFRSIFKKQFNTNPGYFTKAVDDN